MSDPFIIMSAPNGARRQKSDHPLIPLTADELAVCAEEVRDAGATILHLHVRDDDGRHTINPARYRDAIQAVKSRVGDDLVLQITSEAVGMYDRFEQMEMVRTLKPEAVSLALRELCPDEGALADFSDFTGWMKREHIFPQYILYDDKDLDRFEAYRQRGVFGDDLPFVLFVLGRYGGDHAQNSPLLVRSKTYSLPWAVCGFGTREADAASHAARFGGHIRVGFENNIHETAETLLPDHTAMINLARVEAAKAGRAVATIDDVRDLFSL